MNWTDFVAIGVIILFSFRGLRQGLVVTLIRLVKFFASIFLANMFYKNFADFAFSGRVFKIFGNLGEKINLAVGDFLTKTFNLGATTAAGTEPVTNSQMNDIVNSMNFPESVETAIHSELSQKVATTSAEFLNIITDHLTEIVSNALSFVLLFIVFMILFTILEKLTKIITNLPVIRTFNGIGGAILGAVQGVLFLMILIFIINTFGAMGHAENIIKLVHESVFAKYFVDFNFVFQIIDYFVAKIN